ncbi:hypothetical protein LCGC14_1996900 [marine sediment metagenome]|uniref:Uncharacterized protein n=1 Tax=marine sediment metagenome TaxID=412755 RepID=A0A0F9F461_9ZZZZ
MKFTIEQRMTMGFLFPMMADLLTLDVCEGVKQKMKLTEAEKQKVDYRLLPDGGLWFDNKKEGAPKEVPLTDAEIYMLQDLLREKITAKQVPAESRLVCHKVQELVPKEKRPKQKPNKPA